MISDRTTKQMEEFINNLGMSNKLVDQPQLALKGKTSNMDSVINMTLTDSNSKITTVSNHEESMSKINLQ